MALFSHSRVNKIHAALSYFRTPVMSPTLYFDDEPLGLVPEIAHTCLFLARQLFTAIGTEEGEKCPASNYVMYRVRRVGAAKIYFEWIIHRSANRN